MNTPWDVTIVGAGPVGLFLANLLGARGLKTLVLEKRKAKPETSRAIGIMPPSMELLETVGLADSVVQRGVQVTRAVVHGSRHQLGSLEFSNLDGAYPFLLSIPAHRTEAVLENGLSQRPDVQVKTSADVSHISQSTNSVTVHWSTPDTDAAQSTQCRFAVACDGSTSTIRPLLSVERSSKLFPHTFLMADFVDRSKLENDAHLFFTHAGAVESFPLPDGHRRWIIQTSRLEQAPQPEFFEQTVHTRTGLTLMSEDRVWLSPFGIERHLCDSYWEGRVALCGDAAHVMPPIGGQGMNTGFADAWLLAECLERIIKNGTAHEAEFEEYTRRRRIAAWAAMQRAELSMRIGTASGHLRSALRNGLVYAALHTSIRSRLSPRFAMKTIPYGTREQLSS